MDLTQFMLSFAMKWSLHLKKIWLLSILSKSRLTLADEIEIQLLLNSRITILRNDSVMNVNTYSASNKIDECRSMAVTSRILETTCSVNKITRELRL